MKLFKNSALLTILVFSSPVNAAGWLNSQYVHEAGVKYGNGCVTLVGGEVIKIDLTTDAGKAEYALALAAISAGKTIDIHQTDGALIGGCGSGTTIKPHSMLKINQ